MAEMLSIALDLAAKGFAVFPCRPGGKAPLHAGSFHDATRDPDQITKWWEEEPNANPAIYPHGSEPRLVVLDVDVKDGTAETEAKDGRDALADLQSRGICGPTFEVNTPSGGLHLYYRLAPDDPKLPSSAGRLGTGLDIRSSGGYVLAPGAVVEGVHYLVSADRPYSPATPEFIVRCGTSEHRSENADSLAPGIRDWDEADNVDRARHWLRGQIAAGRVAVSGHGGNDFTYQTAEVVRDFGLSEHMAYQVLLDTWNIACVPPWHPDDLQTIVGNAYRYAKRPAGEKVAVNPSSLDRMLELEALEDDPAPEDTPNPYLFLRRPEWRSLQDPAWLIDGTIPEKSLGIIFGQWGSFKSFVTFDMMARLSLGVDWAGHKTQGPCRIGIVAGEGSPGFRKRMEAIEMEIGQECPDILLSTVMPPFNDTKALVLFKEAIQQRGPLKVIVLDTAAQALAGIDENSASDVGVFTTRCNQLIRAFNCTLILVAHEGKDGGRGVRGSSAFQAAADWVLRVQRPGTDNKTIVTMVKQKDAEPWEKPHGFDLIPLASSLAPRPMTPESMDRKGNDMLEAVARWDAFLQVLNDHDRYLTTRTVAEEMAKILTPEAEVEQYPEAVTERTEMYVEWMKQLKAGKFHKLDNRFAETRVARYVGSSTKNKITWRLPEGDRLPM